MSNDSDKIRLSKHLSQEGLCSRREADKLIEQGMVLVNGKPALLGQRVSPEDQVEILRAAKQQLSNKVSILLHKPVGFVSAQAEDGHTPAIRLLEKKNLAGNRSAFKTSHLDGLAPAGRLDIDSKGLLILTQDGVVAKAIIGENSRIDKEYIVKVQGKLSEKILSQLEFGLSLDGKPLKRATIKDLGNNLIKFILVEGKKRQIRRMCEAVGLKVMMLKRIRVGPIKLGDLPEGEWRYLSESEVAAIKNYT